MAVSLFRRWRSQKFRDLVGQESVVSTLQNVLLAGSPARAYLFTGPRGTGKTSSARIFAKAINCERGPAAEPCGECHQCVSIAEGNNLDVFEIDAASHTQVDKIRDFIVEKVHFTPVAARHKVYIIDEVHKLSTSSFNALLKTLEEPPSHVVFILATTHAHEMPATILSRCQRYDFRPLTASETERHLLMIAKAENLQVDPDAARQLARAADGSLRDALVLFEQAVVFGDGRVTAEKVLDLLGGVGYEVLEEMFLDLIHGRSAGALRRLDEWIGRGRDLKRLAESFQEHLRMMLLLKVRSEDQTIRHLSEEERKSLEKLCAALTVGAITSWLRQIMELLAAIRHGHAARLEWEMLLVACAQPEIDPTLQGLERRLERLEAGAPLPASGQGASPDLLARLEALEARSPVGAGVDERLLARIEELEARPPGSADDRVMARLEALESEQSQAHDARLWEKLTRLEAELDAWKDRMLSGPATMEEESQDSPAVVATPVPLVPEPTRPALSSPPVDFSEEALFRDAVDDWIEMPAVLVNPEDFRRELSLFSSYSAAPDPEPETPEPELEPEVVEVATLEIEETVEIAHGANVETVVTVTQATVRNGTTALDPGVDHAPAGPTGEAAPIPASVLSPEADSPARTSMPQARVAEPEPPRVVAAEPPKAPPAPATPSKTVQSAPKPAALDPKEFWRSLMLSIKERDKRLHAVLTDARLAAVEEARLEIALPTGFDWHRDKLLEGRKVLEQVASELAGGRSMTMECTLGGEKASPPKDSEHDEMVARAAGVFGGASIIE